MSQLFDTNFNDQLPNIDFASMELKSEEIDITHIPKRLKRAEASN
jgi:hypothetical protein